MGFTYGHAGPSPTIYSWPHIASIFWPFYQVLALLLHCVSVVSGAPKEWSNKRGINIQIYIYIGHCKCAKFPGPSFLLYEISSSLSFISSSPPQLLYCIPVYVFIIMRTLACIWDWVVSPPPPRPTWESSKEAKKNPCLWPRVLKRKKEEEGLWTISS